MEEKNNALPHTHLFCMSLIFNLFCSQKESWKFCFISIYRFFAEPFNDFGYVLSNDYCKNANITAFIGHFSDFFLR